MIGSHNTMTYLPARRWWWRLLTQWWRCQRKPLWEQWREGIDHLDIRVRRDERGLWRLCHGRVDLRYEPALSLSSLLNRIFHDAPGATMRVVMERGCETDEAAFRAAIVRYREQRPGAVTRAAVKKPWADVGENEEAPSSDDYFKPIDTGKLWWRQIGRMVSVLWTTPRLYARRHPLPTGEALESIKGSRDHIVFRDYV